MDQFIQFLSKKRIVNANKRAYYAQWVRNLYRFVRKRPGEPLHENEVRDFLASVTDTHHDWQVQQAEDALRLYLYFQNQSKTIVRAKSSGIQGLWADAVDQMVTSMRLKHLAYNTEQTYLGWMRQFYRHVSGVAPGELNTKHVTDFLTFLAIERKVAKAPQLCDAPSGKWP